MTNKFFDTWLQIEARFGQYGVKNCVGDNFLAVRLSNHPHIKSISYYPNHPQGEGDWYINAEPYFFGIVTSLEEGLEKVERGLARHGHRG